MKEIKKAISLIIRNNEGKVFVVRRSATKSTFPNCLSLPSVYQLNDESFKDTANRLAKSKLGLKSVVISDDPIGISDVVDRKENLLQMYDFEVKKFGGDISLNPEDYTEGIWMSPQELHKTIGDGQMGECTRTLLKAEGLLG